MMSQIVAGSPVQCRVQRQVPSLGIARKSSLRQSVPAFRSKSALKEQRHVVVRASGKDDVDFDSLLSDIADKFEKSDNKAAIIGYSFAALFALWFSEWFIHLPVLNFLLGGSIQLVGLLLLPYFSVKYLVDNDSITGDASRAVDRVVKKLPGLNK